MIQWKQKSKETKEEYKWMPEKDSIRMQNSEEGVGLAVQSTETT